MVHRVIRDPAKKEPPPSTGRENGGYRKVRLAPRNGCGVSIGFPA
jgi:hypothetical protein